MHRECGMASSDAGSVSRNKLQAPDPPEGVELPCQYNSQFTMYMCTYALPTTLHICTHTSRHTPHTCAYTHHTARLSTHMRISYAHIVRILKTLNLYKTICDYQEHIVSWLLSLDKSLCICVMCCIMLLV